MKTLRWGTLAIWLLMQNYCLAWQLTPRHVGISRRDLGTTASDVSKVVATVLVSNTVFPGDEALAADPQDLGEAIRRSATKLPGYGPSDVFFPGRVGGTWKMTREVDFQDGKVPLRLAYSYRFIPSIEDAAVVADRGFNQAQLESTVMQLSGGSNASTNTPISYEWQYTNPNDLRLTLSNGRTKEIKVTKRATDLLTDGLISSSEFQRVTQEGPRGIPDVSARRVVTKWRIVNDSTMEGMEVIYSMPGGDPMTAGTMSSAPSILSKSRLLLVR